ncbi:hypothetical protein [Pseudoalteromonas sp. BSi20495]|uniref:hypothetical protein n=1 Tax=Pseudoalteromonas sp. BSi20495 TaxID=386429 RepID=UPI000231565E|nr:hypothetical protein [Pseudoalteromonas sp. BSi20495]GAA79222.1 hypothetical protein P20495_1720 [Pseudoalteromonas sp. BSi20495]
MVKQAIKRLIQRYFPELSERKHLPQLARIEKIYDLPSDAAAISTAFRPLKAADVQLLNPLTNEPLAVPVFQQVTLGTGQASDHGLLNEPMPGMQCLIQYIDGLNSHPVITSLLPWQSLVPEHKRTDVTLQQNSRSKIQGRDGNWHTTTDGDITQTSDTSKTAARKSEQNYHQRTCSIDSHDIAKIDGNQINEVMGALKTVVGEKALIIALEGLLLGSKKQVDIEATENMNLTTLKTLHAKATELAKVEGKTIWLGDSSVNVAKVLLDLISLVKDINQSLETHGHKDQGAGPPITKGEFTGHKSTASDLKSILNPIVAN